MDGDENGSLFSQPCNWSWRNGLQQLAPRQLTLKGAPSPFQARAQFIQVQKHIECHQIHLSKLMVLFVYSYIRKLYNVYYTSKQDGGTLRVCSSWV